MHQEIAPVLHGVQAWQKNVLHDVQAWQQNVRSMLEHILKQQEEFNRVVNDIRLEVQRRQRTVMNAGETTNYIGPIPSPEPRHSPPPQCESLVLENLKDPILC